MNFSIIIPTYNHCDDLLKPCLESIFQYTNMDQVELVVVANGCTDNTKEYLETNYPTVKLIWSDEPLGYTKATNLGIQQATGDYLVLLNNDTILLAQEVNNWLDLLVGPFSDPKVGITGPVKFDWDCGGVTHQCMAFWLVMIKREVFDRIGILDEIYSPGMGEDGDFCIRLTQAGYSSVSVPEDIKGHFDTGVVNLGFPIWHAGNGTFADDPILKNTIIERNTKILADKYGKRDSNVGKWVWYQNEQNHVPYGDGLTYRLGAEFLKDCATVEDWGCGTCFMSTQLDPKIQYTGLDGTHSKFVSNPVDLVTHRSQVKPDGLFMRHVLEHNYDWNPILKNAVASFGRKFVLVLFTPINTTGTYTMQTNPEIGVPDLSFNLTDILNELTGLKFNVEELQTHTQYGVEYIFYIEKQTKNVETTVVIPTYNHLEDALRPCLENALAFTDLTNKEIIVVANGCTDGTRDYLISKKDQIRYIFLTEPCGYIRAVNWGIASNNSNRVVLLDNDSILSPQPVDEWINVLQKPFSDPTVGASSPFANMYDNMGLVLHSGCTMYNRQLLRDIGMFDEIYNPGYFSDSDVAMKVWKAGYKCVEVPEFQPDKHYENGMFSINFPVVHTGHVQTMDKNKDNAIVRKNRVILYSRYSKTKKYSIVIPTYNHCDDLLRPCIESIQEFTDLENVEIVVVANGCVDNTKEYLDSLGSLVKVVWSDQGLGYTKATNEGIKVSTGEYVVLLNNDTQFLIQGKNSWLTRLVEPFSDPKVGVTGVLELNDKSSKADFLVFFCVMIRRAVFDRIGILDEIFSPGYGEDIDFCIRAKNAGYKCVCIEQYFEQDGKIHSNYPIWHKNNKTFGEIAEYSGEIVVRNSEVLAKRYGNKMKKYSVVIPTYNHCDDLLRPLCESMMKYTDMSLVEVIIVANGCKDNTREYVESLGEPFKLIWSEEAIGYTKATNLGIKEAYSEYVILLNNDTELLPQAPNQWLDMMEAPFADPKMGMVGPLELFDNYSNHRVLIFFCAMVKKKIFDEIGILDEIYSPGGGEDIDFTVRVKQAGYKTQAVVPHEYSPRASTNVGSFPIWHKDNQTFKDIPEYSKVVIKKNGLLNCHRYNDNLKLNLGSGGVNFPGFLSVDLYDSRALIKMDITKLEFADNTVSEIIASHVFEHLNPYHTLDILKEWNRVLKPGGKLSMEMPDIEKLCKSFTAATDYYAKMGLMNAIYCSVNTTGEGTPDQITSPHLFGWWPDAVLNHLQHAGYVDITFPPEQWSHPGDNLRVEAYKPARTIDHAELNRQEPMTYKEIFQQNSYGLETVDVRGRSVIDIGGNLGMFSLACVEKGAMRSICVEAQPVIFNLGLVNNVRDYPMITALNYAASDTDGTWVHILNEHVGSRVGGDIGDLVETITLETIMQQHNITDADPVLKLDCEGSEFNILMGTDISIIRKFSTIFMEVHDNTNVDPRYQDSAVVVNRLRECGFNCIKEGRMVRYNEDGTTTPLGVYVQKWVRV